MAKRKTIQQGALGGIAPRDISFDVPEEGEIFKSDASNQLFYQKGGQIFQIPGGTLSNDEKVSLGGSPRAIEQREAEKFLLSAGVDFGGDIGSFLGGLREQNIGDLQTAGLVKSKNQQLQFGTGTPQDFAKVFESSRNAQFGIGQGATEKITGAGARTFKDIPKTTATPPRQPVVGFPQSSDELEKWRAMGRTFENGQWLEPAFAGDQGIADVNALKAQDPGQAPEFTPSDEKDAGALSTGNVGAFTIPEGTYGSSEIIDLIVSKSNAISSAYDTLADELQSFEAFDANQALTDYYSSIGVNIKDAFETIKTLSAEANSIRGQISALDAQEANALDKSSDRKAPMEFIRGEHARIQNQYNKRRTALATQLSAVGLQQAALQNNLTMAQTFAKDFVDLATAENKFEYDRVKDFIDINSDKLELLDKQYSDVINFQLDERKRLLDIQTAEKTHIANMVKQFPGAFAGVNLNTLTFDETNQMVRDWQIAHPEVEKASTQIVEIDGKKTLVNTQTGKVIRVLETGEGGAEGAIPTLNGKPMTSTQAKSFSYGTRMVNSDVIITELGPQFVGLESYLGEKLPNFMKSEDRQRYEQAQRNFVNAKLREESGAAIAESEFDSAIKQYFPRPGDSEETIAQKAANRQTVINGMATSANVSRETLDKNAITDETRKIQMSNQVGPGKMLVISKEDNVWGIIPVNEWDPNIYIRGEAATSPVTTGQDDASQFRDAPKSTEVKDPKNLFDWMTSKFK